MYKLTLTWLFFAFFCSIVTGVITLIKQQKRHGKTDFDAFLHGLMWIFFPGWFTLIILLQIITWQVREIPETIRGTFETLFPFIKIN